MARTYYDWRSRIPMFSNERGVGNGMANDSTDVMLVQLLLRGILHGGKSFLGSNLKFTRPAGPLIGITGVWDNVSGSYLREWEDRYRVLRDELQFFNTLAEDYVDPKTVYPGKVVPYANGGRKIIAMGRMSAMMFGAADHSKLTLPDTVLPDSLARELFYSRF